MPHEIGNQPHLSASQRDQFANQLLNWWDQEHRDLPWRRTSLKGGTGEPYAVWVSEVMLQQTQIATVIPYYERWMARFPDIEALAQASIDDVLKEWQGLGYYRRARNLHAAAGIIWYKHGGRLPEEVSELMKLPGIGRYTAGAIASIAFDRPAPVLDGNITRVLSRLIDLSEDVSLAATRHKLWRLAEELMPAARPGDYNQALMELGQRVCLGPVPLCSVCPASSLCLARQHGTQYERPVRPARKRIPHYDVVAGVIWRREAAQNGEFLIARRPFDGMLGGLWEFPGGKVEHSEDHHQALKREITEELAITISVGEHLCTIVHAYTHFRITLSVFCARMVSGTPQHLGVADHAWVTLGDLDRYAFAATDLRIIDRLREAFS